MKVIKLVSTEGNDIPLSALVDVVAAVEAERRVNVAKASKPVAAGPSGQ